MLSKPLKLIVGPKLVPFAGVVEDDVENDLDVVLVQFSDEHLELVDLLAEFAEIAVLRLRREEGDGVVSPCVEELEAALGVSKRRVVAVELHDRQQLDGGDPKFLQIRDFLDETSIRAAEDALGRMMPGEARRLTS